LLAAVIILLLTVCCLSYANGANDNFKGVATLFGSGTANYRRALLWAAVTTFLGSLTAVFLAQQLLQHFTGKGLVEDGLVGTTQYSAAVALGAGLTVLLATRLGFPISTTHSLVGALVGAGIAAGSGIHAGALGSNFFVPLLVSPLLAFLATVVCYPLLHRVRQRCGVTEETCFCVGQEVIEIGSAQSAALTLQKTQELSVQIGDTVTCQKRYQGRMLGLQASTVLDRGHYLSGGLVSFARGLNDTPKIAALLLLIPWLGGSGCVALVAVVMALGGLISVKRVAETMSKKITPMNHGQGFTANLITSVIVLGASGWGMPVSTTHVSCGALFGIGSVTRQGHWDMIGKIVAAWVITLPVGAMLGAAAYAMVPR
jgi:PiT family inorganic phosphate transporter